MEIYPAKKANKANKPLEAIYPLEWEERAFQEVIRGFQIAWRNTPERFEELLEENQNITPPIPSIESESKALIALHEQIYRRLILREPYLCRILAYISFAPEDREARKAFSERYLQKVRMETYHNSLDQDVLVGSELAKSRKHSGIPFHSCFVGQVLQWMLNRFESQRLTDEGNPELVRFERIPNGLIIEYMNKTDFNSPLADSIADDILYKAVNNAQRDIRQKAFFGEDLDNVKYKIIKRCKGQKDKPIPFQLLPKYAGLIRNRAKSLPKVETTTTGSDGKVMIKRTHDFTRIEMVLLEAVLDQSPKKRKPANKPFSAFIVDELKGRLGKEWDDESTMALRKSRQEQMRWQHIQSDEKDVQSWFKKEERISKAKMEQSGGSLDDWNDQNDEGRGRRIDSIRDDDGIDPESEMADREDMSLRLKILAEARKDERLMKILKDKENGIPLSMKDQKYYERKIAEIKKMFGLK